MVRISFEYTTYERMRCVRALNGGSLIGLLLVFGIFLQFRPSFDAQPWLWWVVASILACAVLWVCRLAFIQSEPYRGIRTLSFDSSGISLVSDLESVQAYALVAYKEYDKYFSLETPGHSVISIPKRIFSSASELDEFRECAVSLLQSNGMVTARGKPVA